jgi:hypothetical protein
MSLEIDAVAPASLPYIEPVISVSHVIPDSSGVLHPSKTAGASITARVELAAQLASETIPELQTQADIGDQAAIAELEWRANHQQLQPAELNESRHASESHGSTSPQEPGKGTQIDETA